MKARKSRSRIKAAPLVALTVFGLSLATSLGIAAPRVAAAQNPTPINLTARNTDFTNSSIPEATCVGHFAVTTKNVSYYRDYVGLPIKSLSDIPSLQQYDYGGGSSGSLIFNNSEANFVLADAGSSAPVIEFSPAPMNSQPQGGYLQDNSGICASLMMIPISKTEWRAIVGHDYSLGGTGLEIVDYHDVKASGSDSQGVFDGLQNTINSFIVQGRPQFTTSGGAGGTVSNGNGVHAQWVNAATIMLNSDHSAETYQKLAWNSQSDYFLVSTNDPGRKTLTYSENPQQKCDPSTACDQGNTCVPFIHLDNADLNFADHNTADLQTHIDGLGAKLDGAAYYDYNPDCSPVNTRDSSGVVIPINIISDSAASSDYPRIWLAYSKKNDAFVTLFSSGDSYESPYLGQYTKQAAGTYFGPQGACNIINANPGDNQFFSANWSLYPNCSGTQRYGVVKVMAIADEQLYTSAVSAASSNAIGGAHVNETASSPKLKCTTLTLNPLNWFICPLIDGAQALVSGLDGAINSILSVNTNEIFGTANATNPYYAAWNTFRIFGLALIFIAALIAIITHAMGVELLDAYTLRKVLPRIVAAVVGISLSWYIMRFMVDLSNDAGNSIRALIYAPFSSMPGIKIGNGTTLALGLIGGVAGIALGAVGLLSLVATAALAVIIGFVALVFRNLLIIMLIMLAPFAIACAVLPNTKKAWDFWEDSFTKALLMFPIIAAFIATGRVFAAVTAYKGGLINNLIAFAAYFAPYFLIAFAFKLAGGIMATVGGMVNDRSRGVFDRLRKVRGNQVAQNLHKMGEGQRFESSNRLASGFNRATRGAAIIGRGDVGMNPAQMRSRYRAALSSHASTSVAKFMDNEDFKAISGNDDFVEASNGAIEAVAGSGIYGGHSDEAVRKFLAARGYSGDTLEDGVAAIRKARRATDLHTFEIASTIANSSTGTGFREGAGEMHAAINAVAGDDRVLAGRMLAEMRGRAMQAGRLDLGGGGFGDQQKSLEKQFTDSTYTRDQATLEMGRNALKGQGGGAVANARIQAVKRLAPIMLDDLKTAMQTGDQRLIDREMAKIAGRYDALAQVAPEKAEVYADEVFGTGLLGVPGAAGEPPRNITVRQYMEEIRQRAPGTHGEQDFLDMRREYSNAMSAEMREQILRGMPGSAGIDARNPLEPGNF